MKLGTLLIGGLLGAAATIYVQKRTKPLLFSALSSNDNAMNFLNNSGKPQSQSKSKNSSASTSVQPSFQSSGMTNTTGTNATGTSASGSSKKLDESLFKEDGLNKVEDIVNQDPKLREAVDEILAGGSSNESKTAQQTH